MATVLLIDPAQGADPTDPAVQRAAYAQRAFPKSQQLLEGTGDRSLLRPISLTWHDRGLSPYRGALALVNQDAVDLVPLLGAVLRVSAYGRSVLVSVVGTDDIDEDVSLARRAYLALAPWNIDPLLSSVEVVHEP